MTLPTRSLLAFVAALCFSVSTCAMGAEAVAEPPYKPTEGQAGKDVVWVPTPAATVAKMLDMAKVTPNDFVMDLGSGDGRNIIAAAKRGARAVGVEYNQELVDYANRRAALGGVADKARFVQGDMYVADISQATVLALFLLTQNLDRLVPQFLALKPGTRIVINTFRITGWEPDETEQAGDDCGYWCTVLLYIVPAKADGVWRIGDGTLTLKQDFQKLSGTWQSKSDSIPLSDARLRGDQISFTLGKTHYTGRINGDRMTGTMKGQTTGMWTAVRGDGKSLAAVRARE